MTFNAQDMTALRANEGRPGLLRSGALISIDLKALAASAESGIDVLKALQKHCDEWAISPDLYTVALCALAASPDVRSATREELAALVALAWRFDCFPKPLIALIDVHPSNSTLALTQFTTHRVGGAAYRFAVPAFAARGGLPLGGLARTLARLPDATGMYLALTRHTIGPTVALELGLLTHTIEASRYPALLAALADAQPVDPLLDTEPSGTDVASDVLNRAAIARCFSASSPENIIAALAAENGSEAAWAHTTLAALNTRSEYELAATHRLISTAAKLDLRATLLLSYNIARQFDDAAAASPPTLDRIFSSNITDFVLPDRTDFPFGRF